MAARKSNKEGCERCGEKKHVNTYKRGDLPRVVYLCDRCWTTFCWARTELAELWRHDPSAFLAGYIAKKFLPYPENPEYEQVLGLRDGWRYRAMCVRQRSAVTRGFAAREEGLRLFANILEEPYEELRKKVLKEESPTDEINATESYLKRALEKIAIYTHYLKNIPRVGIVTSAGIVSEIGSARTVLCWRHKRGDRVKPELFSACEHGRAVDVEEALRLSRPNERVYGIRAFPSTAHLASFFGLGFRDVARQNGHAWWIGKRPIKDEKPMYSNLRKTLAVQFLVGMGFEMEPRKNRGPDTPWTNYYEQEKIQKRAQWQEEYRNTPPPACGACVSNKCEKCHTRGDWEKSKNLQQGIWVCRCHPNGYRFGCPEHLRNHARRKTAKHFLDLLYHVWMFLEDAEPRPRHPLIDRYLTV